MSALDDWNDPLGCRDVSLAEDVISELQAAIESLQPQWVSVDVPPKEPGRYLCCLLDEAEGLTDVAFASFYSGHWITGDYQKATYYMPIPNPPESDK